MKIVYCLNSIKYLGGIQRVTIVKANALADIPGNEVYIIVSDNKHGLSIQPLSPKVHLIDLDINYYEDDWKSKWNILKGIIIKRREHKRRLAKTLQQIDPDIVISAGQSEKNILPSIRGNWAKVREIHFNSDYRWFHINTLFDRISALLGDLYDYHYKIALYDRIVVLTEEDRDRCWKNNRKVSVIPNPVSFVISSDNSLIGGTSVISVGRLTSQKNYASLIRAFRQVTDRHSEWILEIWGDGEEKQSLQDLICQLRLEKNVFLKGYTADVETKLRQSGIFVISSLYEGFQLVMVEAMSCGLPVVSYSCPCGPKDIITDGKDGFLVPVNDEKALAEKICYLIEHEEERKSMGMAAREKSKLYSIDNITAKWMDLFNKLIDEKHGK